MNSKNFYKDPVLEKIVNETAQELGINADMVWKVYGHAVGKVYDYLTEDSLQYLTKAEKIKRARNVVMPGFGRFINVFGKTFKTKGIKEPMHKPNIELNEE